MEKIISETIQSFGFPVAVALGCGWFIWKIYWQQQADNREDKEKLYVVLANVNNTNTAILQANKEILDSNRNLMNDIRNDIGGIKTDMGEIKNAVTK